MNAPPKMHPLTLTYNQDGISTFANKRNGDFDGRGNSLASESLPSVITTEDICFQLGPRDKNLLNVLSCEGQILGFEAGKYKQVYILAASADKDITAQFRVGETDFPLTVQCYSGFYGVAEQQVVTSKNTTADKQTASFRKPATIAWMRNYMHTADEGLMYDKPVYLFKYKLPVPKYAETLRLPNEPSIKILAITLADNPNDSVMPAGLDD
jgi:alpha-mannosidase